MRNQLPRWCRFDWAVLALPEVAVPTPAPDARWHVCFGDRDSNRDRVQLDVIDYLLLDPGVVIDAGDDEDGHWVMLNATSTLPIRRMAFGNANAPEGDEWMYRSWFPLRIVPNGEVTTTPQKIGTVWGTGGVWPNELRVDPLWLWAEVTAIDLTAGYSDDYRVASSGHAQVNFVRFLCAKTWAQSDDSARRMLWVQFFLTCYNTLINNRIVADMRPQFLLDETKALAWFGGKA